MEFLLYLALGACAGVLAGLFGVGGGIIIVPVLVFSFTLQGSIRRSSRTWRSARRWRPSSSLRSTPCASTTARRGALADLRG
jgi:hypothetical protein